MGVSVQVRDVPEEVHRRLKARAAESGRSLSGFVRLLLEKEADRPPVAEIVQRLEKRGRLTQLDSTAEDVRELRDAE